MTFAESVSTCLKKYVDFNVSLRGRNFGGSCCSCSSLAVVLGWASPLLANIFGLAMLLPELAVGARRLHDTGRSGWWQLLLLIPVIGVIILIVFWVQEIETLTSRGVGRRASLSAPADAR
jgi:uncharacterized membrane protein YhaH (DUF805 family)